jgi:hypothetical protein
MGAKVSGEKVSSRNFSNGRFGRIPLRACASNFEWILDGGAEGSRTPDLFIANEALYQLSYDPIQEANTDSFDI